MPKVGMQTFSYVRKSQIHNFMGSFQSHPCIFYPLWDHCHSTFISLQIASAILFDLPADRKSTNLWMFQSANYESVNFSP